MKSTHTHTHTHTHTQFAEMALAHELTHPEGGPSPLYHVAEGRLYMHREQYDKAQESLTKAITMDIQVALSCHGNHLPLQ